MNDRKVLLVLGGDDWYNASVVALSVPTGHNYEEDCKAYPGYVETYYTRLEDWLIREYGYNYALEDQVVTWCGHDYKL